VDLMLENMSIPFMAEISFPATEETKEAAALGSAVMGWAWSKAPALVLDVEMSLYDMEVIYNVGKAAYTQQLLMVADGKKPAVDIHLMLNETTKAEMVLKVQGTLALLGQLEGLKTLHGMNMLLVSKENMVAHIYYKQLDEDPEGAENEGSVEYHGEEAKKVDDAVGLYGTTIPIVLYVIAAVLILIGIALIVAGPKEEPVEEEEEQEEGEEPAEEGEGEEEEGGGEE